MEAQLDQVLNSAKQALQAFEGPLAHDVDAALRLSQDSISQSGVLRTKIEDTIQTLHKLQQILTPPQVLFMDGIFAATNTKVFVCAAQYHLADILAKKPLSVPDLAAAANIDLAALRQLLRYLLEMGFFSLDPATGLVRNNRASELLREDHWTTWRNWIDQYAGEHYDILARLPDAVTAGAVRSAAQLFYDTDEPIYAVMERKGMTAGFHKAISAFSVAEAPGLLGDYPWQEVVEAEAVVTDVGAGAGDFLRDYLRAFPRARAAAFELPQTAELIRERFAGEAGEGGVRERLVEVRAGDFFADALPASAVYFLKFVFHNWDDEHCIRLLQRLREAMPVKPGVSRVLVVENVIREGRLGAFARYADIRMLSRVKNKERTYEEYRDLARAGGFEIHGMMTPRGCLTQVLDLRPVSDGFTNGVH